MRLLLLQDHIYLPSYGGGVKANRLLLEGLARRGHRCTVVAPAFAPSAGPADETEFHAEMARRSIVIAEEEPPVFSYHHRDVDVDAVSFPTAEELRSHVERRIGELRPDWVIVNDDKLRLLLAPALAAAGPDRVVLLLQTVTNAPFGPLSLAPSRAHARRMREARAVVAISRFLQSYLARHGSLAATVLSLPVYGEGPFPALGGFDRRYVTMLNPCLEKGVDLFLALAQAMPEVDFAAVRGWGTDSAVLCSLEREPNVTVLEPADELDAVLAQTRVLLAPSLWPETFGYIVPEAMLRGIPVLASDIGGLREAALGAALLLPVVPLERRNGRHVPTPQNAQPWRDGLGRLLSDPTEYARRSRTARAAALAHASRCGVEPFESLLAGLAAA